MPLPAGLMRVRIVSLCRRRENIRFLYAGIELIRTLDETGELRTDIDCIAGSDFPVDVLFEDGSRNSLKVTAHDLNRVTKVAVLWQAPVNLNLHAFEYAAQFGEPGHVWESAPSSVAEALGTAAEVSRSHGFMSSISSGAESGTKMEVYTFWHHANQRSGVISMALDYESRARRPQDPDTCGNGLYAEIRYEAILLDRNKSFRSDFGSLAAIDCAMPLSGMARYNKKTIPAIIIKP